MTNQSTPVPSPRESVRPTSRLVDAALPVNAIRCSCGDWWTGMSAAHCGGCHLTFTSVSGFTAHRKGGNCSNPAEIGMVRADRKYPAWAMPGTWAGPEDAA